ncbi:MAG: DNA cytosine methyltransferase [Proteobacteria bacterium]|nr:DNA cytosine methyltransferase [Pseudomonadota bacterium]
MNVVDLFCGCGGLSKGFEKAGFNVILGVDNEKSALTTFEKNHLNSVSYNGNLFKSESLDEIANIVSDKNVDIIVGGPPCQGFSLAGTRNFDDERNTLYLSMIKLIEKLSPKAFVIENVMGMNTLYKGAVKEEIIKRLSKLGYNITNQVLCSADYGVPQIRKRLIFVGIKKEFGEFSMPKPILSPDNYITCEDALSDLPGRENDLGIEIDNYNSCPLSEYQKNMRRSSERLYNHVATNHTEHVKFVISHVPEGGNHKDLPDGIGDSRKFNEAWTRYHSKKPSRTIDTGHRNHFHYKWNRVPTIRENARLQSFEDDFIFYGTKTQQNKQVGNAVPPLMGYAIAKKIKEYIHEK